MSTCEAQARVALVSVAQSLSQQADLDKSPTGASERASCSLCAGASSAGLCFPVPRGDDAAQGAKQFFTFLGNCIGKLLIENLHYSTIPGYESGYPVGPGRLFFVVAGLSLLSLRSY